MLRWLLIVPFLTGCAMTYGQKQAGVVAGVATSAIGTALLVASHSHHCSDGLFDSPEGFNNSVACAGDAVGEAFLGTLVLAAGLLVLTGSAIAPEAGPPPPPRVVPPAEVTRRRSTARPSARSKDGRIRGRRVPLAGTMPSQAYPEPQTGDPVLRNFTLQASIAARAGQCEAVVTIARRIDRLDRAYRYAGFVRDPAIASCLL